MIKTDSSELKNGMMVSVYRLREQVKIADWVRSEREDGKGEAGLKHNERYARLGLQTLAQSVGDGLLRVFYPTFCEHGIGDFFDAHEAHHMTRGNCDQYRYNLSIWRDYFRARYSKEKGDWANFDRVDIPAEVLDEIEFADSLKIFKDLEIWHAGDSSLVVGVGYGSACFLICRWGFGTSPYALACHNGEVKYSSEKTSDEELKLMLEPNHFITFEEIKNIVLRSKIRWHFLPEAKWPGTVRRFVKEMQGAFPLTEIEYEGKTLFWRCILCLSRMHKVFLIYETGTHWHGLICDNEKCRSQDVKTCRCKQ